MKQEVLDRCLVVTFSMAERTEKLSDLCFKKLGFKNRLFLSTSDGFHDKFLKFAQIAVESEYDFFIRNDADRLVFSGILELLDLVIQNDDISWATGSYYDYLMDRFRIGTPSVHRKDNLQFLVENPSLMKDVQKPEAAYATAIKNKFKIKDVDLFTNLHEFEQYPSKVCNAFLNRLARNHYPRLYSSKHLKNLPACYDKAIKHAFSIWHQQGFKNSMKFEDFSFLDQGFAALEEENLDKIYEKYKEKYDKISKR